jgi:predicted pyridoxine 5'-phosphate oxidase superfamily flavin-nucleotide-binding protein
VTAHDRLRSGVRDALPPHFAKFLTVQRFVILATCDAEGRPWCSMVPGWPGFASAPDPKRVHLDRRAFADEDVLGHLHADPRVGMLALDPSTRRRIRVNGTASIGADAVTIGIVETFGNCRQYIQQRPPGGPEPGGSATVSRSDALEPRHRDWIGRTDTCFLASLHPVAGLDASHRGGRPGFVAVSDDGTLAFDDYPGNNMFQTLGNLTAKPAAAILFVDFESAGTLQLTGEASVNWDVARSPKGRVVRFRPHLVVEKRALVPWRWPVLEYSPVNP